MPSKALANHKAENLKMNQAAELEALAAALDAAQNANEGAFEPTLEDTATMSLDEAIERQNPSNRPYNALYGREAEEVKVNYNPQPVNSWGQGKTRLDISSRIRPSGVAKSGELLSNVLVGDYDVVIMAPSHRDAANSLLVNAILDRLSPEFVIHGGANGNDAIARTWVISRYGPAGEDGSNAHQAEFYANWDLDGPQAGPLRNGEMLKFARKLMKEEGKRVCLLYFFLPDQFGQDRITDSMLSTNTARNAARMSQPHLREKGIIPAIDAVQWMEDDVLASNPVDEDGEVYDLPIPSSIR